MPNIKSAKKRVEINLERRNANKAKKTSLRTAIKKTLASLSTSREEARAELSNVTKKLDQAAAAGLIHKNTAARKKSRMAKKINAMAK